MARATAAVALVAALAGCGPVIDPESTNPMRVPAELTDTAPQTDVVEVSLVASVGTHEFLPGKPTEVWGFRDGNVDGSRVTVPGPTLRARQGDQVIVHFRNELPEATTVHWHGLR